MGDPNDPQVDDYFNDGTQVRKIIWRGDQMVVSVGIAGNERPNTLDTVATWTAVDPPQWITQDTVLHEYRLRDSDGVGGERGWATFLAASATGRQITLHPDHTWTEGAP